MPPGNPNDGAAAARLSFREKLQNRVVRFRNNLTVEAIGVILQIGPLYNNSSDQFWANLGVVQLDKYESKPFIVAVFSGDSKSQSVDYYLKDFVTEISSLVRNGVTIGQRTFRGEIHGFSCKTPAKSFIKKCKGHDGFCACEHCETR